MKMITTQKLLSCSLVVVLILAFFSGCKPSEPQPAEPRESAPTPAMEEPVQPESTDVPPPSEKSIPESQVSEPVPDIKEREKPESTDVPQPPEKPVDELEEPPEPEPAPKAEEREQPEGMDIPPPPEDSIEKKPISFEEVPTFGYVILDRFDEESLEKEHSDTPAGQPLHEYGLYYSAHLSLSEGDTLDVIVYGDGPIWMPDVYFAQADVGFVFRYVGIDEVGGAIQPRDYDLSISNDYYKVVTSYEIFKTGNYQIYLLNFNPEESHLCWLSVDLRPTQSSDVKLTPFGKMTLYHGQRIPLTIEYPAEWIVSGSSPTSYPLTLRHSEDTDSQLTITEPSFQELGLPEVGLEELSEVIINSNESIVPDFTLISTESLKLQDGKESKMIVFSSDAGQRVFYRLIYIHDNGITFHFTYSYRPSQDDIKSLIEYSFSTLSFD